MRVILHTLHILEVDILRLVEVNIPYPTFFYTHKFRKNDEINIQQIRWG